MKAKEMAKTNLESVLFEFRAEAGVPRPGILEAYTRRYPQFARELTDYAVEWLIDEALATTEPAREAVAPESSPLVSKAISRLYNRIRERDAANDAVRPAVSQVRNPFQGLAVARKREIRDELRINTPLLAKFENRLIDPDTAPRGFLDQFARLLESGVEEFIGYLRLPPAMHAAPEFKAQGKPAVAARKESFEEAVRGSSLDEKQKKALIEG